MLKSCILRVFDIYENQTEKKNCNSWKKKMSGLYLKKKSNSNEKSIMFLLIEIKSFNLYLFVSKTGSNCMNKNS